jgi:hypothetical protein
MFEVALGIWKQILELPVNHHPLMMPVAKLETEEEADDYEYEIQMKLQAIAKERNLVGGESRQESAARLATMYLGLLLEREGIVEFKRRHPMLGMGLAEVVAPIEVVMLAERERSIEDVQTAKAAVKLAEIALNGEVTV